MCLSLASHVNLKVQAMLTKVVLNKRVYSPASFCLPSFLPSRSLLAQNEIFTLSRPDENKVKIQIYL